MTDKDEINKNPKKTVFGIEGIGFDKPLSYEPLLQDKMDSHTEKRHYFVNQFELKYFRTYLKKKISANEDLVKKKLNDFRLMVAQKIHQKCLKEFQELEKHVNIKAIDDLIYNLPFFNQDEEYNAAHQDFLNCSSFERHLVTRLEDKIKFLDNFHEFQYKICKKNCIENRIYEFRESYQNCIFECVRYTMKNIDPSIEGILEETVDTYSHILEHMISKDPKL